MSGWFKIRKIKRPDIYITKMKDKNYMIVLIDIEKAFDKNSALFMVKKSLNKLDIEGMYINIVAILNIAKPIASFILTGEPFLSVNNIRVPILTTLFQQSTRSPS